MTTTNTLLEVQDLRKAYGDLEILGGLDFAITEGEFVCIVGPSGSGKTTLLRTVAGLQSASSGSVVFEGQPVVRPPEKMAVVFQDYSRSLMPWMSVKNNILLPIRGRVEKSSLEGRAERALSSVGLAGKGDLYPWQLSGGMQQRAAIARGLAFNPEVLLMDEPFAAVDAQTRADLEDLMLSISQEYNTTVLFVTHDIDEAVYLANRVLVLSGAPTTVVADIETQLPRERNQVETKTLERFIDVRTEVFELIQNAKSHAKTPGSPQASKDDQESTGASA